LKSNKNSGIQKHLKYAFISSSKWHVDDEKKKQMASIL